MTTATAPRRSTLAWESSVADSPRGHLELVWSEIRERHPSTQVLESEILSDNFYEQMFDRTEAAFRAGFASARVVADIGYPPEVDYETLLQAIVKRAGIAQVPGHVDGDHFVPDEAER